jgi:DNA-directed RNA polymerase subunit RPC12/RpoP
MSPKVICADCGESREESTIPQGVSPCPNCGSRKIVVPVKIQEKVEIR